MYNKEMSKAVEERQYYVYIMTNKANTVFYTGVTNDLIRRVIEHKNAVCGFTAKYKLTKLVFYEAGSSIEGAILREKQIKAGSRQDKIRLVTSINPTYRDLLTDFQQ
jgi:putative endonuclease